MLVLRNGRYAGFREGLGNYRVEVTVWVLHGFGYRGFHGGEVGIDSEISAGINITDIEVFVAFPHSVDFPQITVHFFILILKLKYCITFHLFDILLNEEYVLQIFAKSLLCLMVVIFQLFDISGHISLIIFKTSFKNFTDQSFGVRIRNFNECLLLESRYFPHYAFYFIGVFRSFLIQTLKSLLHLSHHIIVFSEHGVNVNDLILHRFPVFFIEIIEFFFILLQITSMVCKFTRRDVCSFFLRIST